MSDKNIHIRGTVNANFLLLKVIAENKAIPVIGATLGGWGNIRVNAANAINNNITIFR